MVQRVVMVSNLKGGVGKTSAAVNLAAAMATHKRRVLLVDLDAQGSASGWLGQEHGERGLVDVLRLGGRLPIRPSSAVGVDLAPFDPRFDLAEHKLNPSGAGGYLRAALAVLASSYSLVFIDTPPTLGALTIAAMAAASDVLIPVEMSALALMGVRSTQTAIGEMRDTDNPDLRLVGVLACRVNMKTSISRAILSALREGIPGKVFDATIRESLRMQAAPWHHKPITDYAGTSQVAQDIRDVAAELRRRLGR
jgi:chromosome partitioning protein